MVAEALDEEDEGEDDMASDDEFEADNTRKWWPFLTIAKKRRTEAETVLAKTSVI